MYCKIYPTTTNNCHTPHYLINAIQFCNLISITPHELFLSFVWRNHSVQVWLNHAGLLAFHKISDVCCWDQEAKTFHAAPNNGHGCWSLDVNVTITCCESGPGATTNTATWLPLKTRIQETWWVCWHMESDSCCIVRVVCRKVAELLRSRSVACLVSSRVISKLTGIYAPACGIFHEWVGRRNRLWNLDFHTWQKNFFDVDVDVAWQKMRTEKSQSWVTHAWVMCPPP